jgi:hypothetical protein
MRELISDTRKIFPQFHTKYIYSLENAIKSPSYT